MRRKLRAAFTIELAYLFPLIMLVFVVLLHLLFYYHDKNILLGAAHETAAYGTALEEPNEGLLENYFAGRVKGKLLLFTKLEKEIVLQEEQVTVSCNASKNVMSLRVKCTVNQTEPEDYIRSVRKIIKLGEGRGK